MTPMRDEELRRLERAMAGERDAAGEARLLAEKVRRGDLAAPKLELAAYLGHEAARAALAGRAPDRPEDPSEWLVGLDRFGREAKMRAAIVLCRQLARTRYDRWAEDDDGRLVLEAAEAVFLDPSDANKAALDRALTPPEGAGRYRGVGQGAYALASFVRAEDSFDDNFAELARQVAERHFPVHPANVMEDVRDDLVPWALGELDPVATRWRREGKRFSSEEGEIIRAVAFSPDGSLAAVANRTGHVRIRAFPSGELVRELPRVSREVFVLAFSPDGGKLATGDSAGVTRLFDAKTGECTATIAVPESGEDAVRGLAYLGPDRLALGFVGGWCGVVEIASGKTVFALGGHERSISALDVSAAGDRIATSSSDGNVRIFDASTGALLRTVEGLGPEDLAFLRDGRLVVGGSGAVAWLLDPVSGASDRFETGGTGIHAVAASPDGSAFAAAPADRAPIFVWDAKTGAVLRRYAWDMSMPMALAWSPDGRHLLMGDRGGGVRVFEV